MKNNFITELLLQSKEKLNALRNKQSITTFDVTVFLRQFATLMTAGIPLVQCCDILEKSQEKPALRLMIYHLKRDILSGQTLFTSMQRHSQYFSATTCQLIKIGEHTGKLDHLLNNIANDQEKSWAMKKQIKNALFYPCFITIIAFIITCSMFIFVVPRFAELFHDMQAKLPTLTLWIFYFSAQLSAHYFVIITIIILSLALLHYYRRIIFNHTYFRQFLFSVPYSKSIYHKIILARFSRQLALTFSAGMSIVDALKLTAESALDLQFSLSILVLRRNMMAGFSLHRAMEPLPYFSQLMLQMVKIGEESGKLDQMLNKIADFFEADIERLMQNLSHLLEPLLMLLLGVLIGGLVIGIYLPIFELGNAL